MLILSRFVNEQIVIGGNITITVVRVFPDGKVRLGIEAPKDVVVDRLEVHERKMMEGRKSL